MPDTPPLTQRRRWAARLGLVLGILGFAVALTAPIPFVPLVSALTWPLGLGAILLNRLVPAHSEPAVLNQSRWGVRLGCLGWCVQFVTSIVKVAIVGSLLATLIGAAIDGMQATPSPTP